jgi:hypothetical protein
VVLLTQFQVGLLFAKQLVVLCRILYLAVLVQLLVDEAESAREEHSDHEGADHQLE